MYQLMHRIFTQNCVRQRDYPVAVDAFCLVEMRNGRFAVRILFRKLFVDVQQVIMYIVVRQGEKLRDSGARSLFGTVTLVVIFRPIPFSSTYL